MYTHVDGVVMEMMENTLKTIHRYAPYAISALFMSVRSLQAFPVCDERSRISGIKLLEPVVS